MVATNYNKRFELLRQTLSAEITGRVVAINGLTIEAVGLSVPVGAQCQIRTTIGLPVHAEVIGFRESITIMMLLSNNSGVACGDHVSCIDIQTNIPVGQHLLGRVLNGSGEPIDGKGPLLCQIKQSMKTEHISPLDRTRIDSPIGTGVRSIDALLTCGRGQRMGIFSGPGVGKSVLLGTIARHTSADISIIAMIGERGREVREFIEKDLGPEGLARSIVIVSTSDEPAPLRIRASFLAMTIAEYFRQKNNDVLLLMDSITRVAMAQRQIGLAVGEPPATKGYTPSVFSLLPQLVERCGKDKHGSITGFFTVLVEGDDMAEPVSDTMRGLLDGHIMLSRELANRGHYPAIDVLDSISRVMPDIVEEAHAQCAKDISRLIAIYRDIEDLVNLGAYSPGSNPEFDLAVTANPHINQFLQQPMFEGIGLQQAINDLLQLVSQLRDMNAANYMTENQQQENQASENQQPSIGMDRMMAGI